MTARPGDQAGGWTFNRPAEGTSDGWLADRAGVTAEIVITADVVAARRLATLDHPSLPRVLDVQEHGSTWLIALEATDDRPLHEVAMGGGLPDEVVVALARSVSEALALAHGAGVVHGRLTPEAVRVDAQGRVKIHDLLAPTEHDAGPDDDAWRLGWCIWVLCTGAQDPPPRPGPLDPGPTRSEVLRACVAGLTEPDPDQRWTPAAAAEALRRSEAQRTIGRYRLGRELGRGGMGVVFDAYDPDLDRPVALKLMAGGRFGDPTAVRRFLAEARAVARLSHPDIVPVLDIGESQDGPFFTMARIEGRTLTEELASRGRIPWRQATTWLARVARALHHAHTRGIVHRDVKPGNVMLEAGTEPRVLDFGLALDVDRTTTVTVGVIGTPAYMAPEQAAGERGRVGPRTDVYALGVMLHELLSGEPAFHGRSPVAVLTAVAQGQAPDLSRVPADVPRDLVRLYRQAMARSPDDRPPSAAAFADDLDRVLLGLPLDRTPRPVPRAWRLSLGAAALVCVAGGGWWVRARAAAALTERQASAEWAVVHERVTGMWGAGDEDGASAAIRAFAALHPGSEAAADAWITLARRLQAGGAQGEAGRAWIQAWLQAPTPELQGHVLLGIAGAHAAASDVDACAAALGALEAVDAASAQGPDAVRLRQWVRVARRRADPGDTPLARALSHGAALPKDMVNAIPWDPEGDGATAWYMFPPGGAALIPADGGASITIPTPCAAGLRLVDRRGAPGLLACGTTQDGIYLDELRDGRLEVVDRHPAASLRGIVVHDLDGDGVDEVYVATDWDVLRVTPAGWVPVDPDTHAAHSQVTGLAATDLDGDGAPELAVALGEWGAYDVRLLEPRHGGLRVTARYQLGRVSGVTPWRGPGGPAIVVGRSDVWPSREAFSAERLAALDASVWLLRRTAEGLVPSQRLDARMPPDRRVMVGDMDGDQVDEILAFDDQDARLFYLDDGAWRDFLLPGVMPVQMGDIDGDGDAEALVMFRDGRERWWLGTGDPLTPSAPATLASVEIPTVHAASVSGAWARATTLARFGMVRDSADAFTAIAAATTNTDVQVAAHEVAARLLESVGADEAAGEQWRALTAMATRDDGDHPAWWLAEAEAWRRAQHPLREHDAILGRRDAAPTIRREADDALAFLDRQAWSPDLRAALDAGWRVDSPVGVRQDTARGLLRVDALPGALMRRPVAWDPDGARLDLDFTLRRMEWSGSLALAFVAEDGRPVIALSIGGSGGGHVVDTNVTVRAAHDPGTRMLPVPLDVRCRISLVWVAARSLMSLSGVIGDAPVHQSWILARSPGDDVASLRLAVGGAGSPRVTVDIHELSITGPTVLSDAGGRAAWLDLVVGRRTDGADPDTQAVLLANAGDAAGALRILRGRPWTQGVIAHGLRTSPDRWGRALFEVDPDGALTALGRVWADGRMIGDPAEAEAAALDTLAGIERRPIPRDPDARAAWAGLLRMRAWALLNAAQVQTAGDTLAALSRLGEVDPTQQERKDVMLWARLHALSGDPDLAMAALLEALEHAPSPSVLSYLILANPDLDPLHGHPRWAEIGGLPAAPP